MTDVSKMESLKLENNKLRNYISLILAEIELTQRIHEIKENFVNPDDSKRVILPILDRISKIKSEKRPLEQELNLN
ncbi:MAG: hypothetical protein OEM77_07905 [Nitrosopumilus sp.]|nr:hypothetical protein [Nitrosopumilus sp.]MDH3735958.1 hypothetical protein [Nitrosopumilus sp.]MDH3823589.1 hypothetical protein [Nitrosopumilus sp.]MDH3833016.1 hypothetical protein [Nitrosopumilus sp.]